MCAEVGTPPKLQLNDEARDMTVFAVCHTLCKKRPANMMWVICAQFSLKSAVLDSALGLSLAWVNLGPQLGLLSSQQSTQDLFSDQLTAHHE